MPKVKILKSFDGHPVGDIVELSDKAAQSAIIQRRGDAVKEGPKGKGRGSKPKYESTLKADLMAMCREREIKLPLRATRDTIVTLLEDADAEAKT